VLKGTHVVGYYNEFDNSIKSRDPVKRVDIEIIEYNEEEFTCYVKIGTNMTYADCNNRVDTFDGYIKNKGIFYLEFDGNREYYYVNSFEEPYTEKFIFHFKTYEPSVASQKS